MHPAPRAVDILNPAPMLVFGGDFQGHPFTGENPVNPVGQSRSASGIAL
jgi:hypothetical protein